MTHTSVTNKLSCSLCGVVKSSVQHNFNGRWFCEGCVLFLASWAIEHGALLSRDKQEDSVKS